MLRKRLVAAALGLPMLFVLLWLNWYLRTQVNAHHFAWLMPIRPDDLPLFTVVLIIATASGWEISRVVRQRFPQTSKWNGIYAATMLLFIVHAIRLASLDNATPTIPVSSLGLLIDSLGSTATVMLLFLGVWSDVEQRGREGLLENLYVVLGGLYLGTSLAAVLLLGQTPLHEVAVAFLFVLVFGMDTAAYFGGKQLGGPKLAPRISPSKTIAGALCGVAAAMLLACVFKLFPSLPATLPVDKVPWWHLGGHVSWFRLCWLSFSIAFFGQLGDLVESVFKRWGGVKDSGAVIPGHGGFLDRFDSLFLSAPVCYLLLTAFLHLPR